MLTVYRIIELFESKEPDLNIIGKKRSKKLVYIEESVSYDEYEDEEENQSQNAV